MSKPDAPIKDPASNEPAEPSALRSGSAHLRLWSVTALCLWADLGTKAWAFHDLSPQGQVLIPGFLRAQRSLNAGALFGSLSGWVPLFIAASILALGFVLYVFASSSRRQWFMHLGLSFILSGALGNLYDRSLVQADVVELKPTSQHGPVHDIGMIVSEPEADPVVVEDFPDGGHPRSYDRAEVADIDHHGVVRDFIKFVPVHIGGSGFDYWPWVFNVADALLVAGVGILLITLWREHHTTRRKGGEVQAPQ